MDDLISRAATLERMKSMAGCATCNNYNYVRCRACSWNDAMNIVEELPTIDTIPVDWLKNHKMKYYEDWGVLPVSVVEVLNMWQKEQEAQDGT